MNKIKTELFEESDLWKEASLGNQARKIIDETWVDVVPDQSYWSRLAFCAIMLTSQKMKNLIQIVCGLVALVVTSPVLDASPDVEAFADTLSATTSMHRN